jgi:hypothetical protein
MLMLFELTGSKLPVASSAFIITLILYQLVNADEEPALNSISKKFSA